MTDVNADPSTVKETSIPMERFEEVNGMLKDTKKVLETSNAQLEQSKKANEELQKRVETLEKPESKPNRYTRAQLSAAVEAEQISQSQADEFWDNQLSADIESRVMSQVTTLNDQNNLTNTLSSQINSYTDNVKGLMEEGSENRNKVTSEFNYLVSIGQPNDKTTELAALRSVFGDVKKLKKEVDSRETHQEIGGGQVNEPEDKGIKSLTQKQKNYYSKQIANGIYRDWKEVAEEVNYSG